MDDHSAHQLTEMKSLLVATAQIQSWPVSLSLRVTACNDLQCMRGQVSKCIKLTARGRQSSMEQS